MDPEFADTVQDYIDTVRGQRQLVQARKLVVAEGLALSTGSINARLQQDSRKRTPLCLAAVSGDEEGLRLLLAAGARVDATDAYGGTALFWAVRNDCIPCVTTLLEAGANIRHIDNYGNSALIRSAAHGNGPMTQFLVEKGSALELRDKDGRTALMRAVMYGNVADVKVLVAAGANASAADETTNMTCLHYCARGQHTEICEVLVEQGGADVHVRDSYNNTAMVYAKDKGNIDLVNIIRKQLRREQGTGEFAPDYDPEKAAEEQRQRDIMREKRRCDEEALKWPCDGGPDDPNDYAAVEQDREAGRQARVRYYQELAAKRQQAAS